MSYLVHFIFSLDMGIIAYILIFVLSPHHLSSSQSQNVRRGSAKWTQRVTQAGSFRPLVAAIVSVVLTHGIHKTQIPSRWNRTFDW
jgi:hypothetical protein